MKKNEKKWKKLRENCNFSFFGKLQFSSSVFFIFFHFFSHFFIIFHHFSSFFINSTTGSKNDKKMIKKMIKKWKQPEENCIFLFFGKFLEHWKQKWWKMIKKWKKWKKWKKKRKKMKKTEGKLQFFIFWKIAIFLEFVFHFFSFFSFFYHASSFFINSTTGSKNDKKNDKNMIKNEKKTRGKLQFSIFPHLPGEGY